MRALLTIIATLPILAACSVQATHSGDERALSERDQQSLEQWIGGREAGEPESCIRITPTTRSTTIGDRARLFRIGGTVYYNDFNGSCPNMDRGTFSIENRVGALTCEGDTVEIQDASSGVFRDVCTYGAFIPYREPDSGG